MFHGMLAVAGVALSARKVAVPSMLDNFQGGALFRGLLTRRL